jgi:hypothetical protein
MKKKFVITPLFIILCLMSYVSVNGQTNVKSKWMTLGAAYTMHGSGDFEGAVVSTGIQQAVSNLFSLHYQLQFSLHGGSAYGFVRESSTDPTLNSVPMYFVIGGVQTSVLPIFHVFGNKKQWLNIAAGPMLRYQVNGSPDSYSYMNNVGTNRPDYYVIKEMQPKVLTVGYQIALESMILHRPKWSMGLKLHFQNDSNGDSIGGIGLVYQRKTKG